MRSQQTKNAVEVKITSTPESIEQYVESLREKLADEKSFSTFNSAGFASVKAVEGLSTESLARMGAVIHVIIGERAAKGDEKASIYQKTLCSYAQVSEERNKSRFKEDSLRKAAVAAGYGTEEGLDEKAFERFKKDLARLAKSK